MDDEHIAAVGGGEHWISPGCDAAVAAGLRALAGELTTSHSLTSRQHAVWSLVAKHVDAPLDTCLARNRQLAFRDAYLDGFRLSRVGRVPPCWIPQRVGLHDWVAVQGNLPKRCPDGIPDIEWQCSNIRHWDENLQAVIHAVRLLGPMKLLPLMAIRTHDENVGTRSDSHNGTPEAGFIATLDSIRALFVSLTWMRPKTGENKSAAGRSDAPRFLDKWTRSQLSNVNYFDRLATIKLTG